MVKGGINKNLFYDFLRCDKLALFTDKFMHLKDSTNPEIYNENEQMFKELVYKIICESEMGYSKNILRNKKFETTDGEIVITDIILKRPSKNILIEIVCSSDLDDGPELNWLAYKYYLIKKTNYQIDDIYVIKVDKKYELNGVISEEFLFVKDVTTKIRHLLPNIPGLLVKIKRQLIQNNLPEKQKGLFCLEPNPCPFKNYCWSDMPNENSVFEIEGLPSWTKFNLFWKGITSFVEIPPKKLDKRQMIQVKYGLRDVPFQKTEKLLNWLNQIEGKSVWFLNMNMAYPVVPLIEGSKPFTAIPFQFSLHYLFLEGTNYTHYPYIGANSTSDEFTLSFIKNLVDDLNRDKEAPIIVYNLKKVKKTFEKMAFWNKEYKDNIENILLRLVDLREVFIECWYYHPKFKGSYDLQLISSIIVPEIPFEKLSIRSNTHAGNIFLKALNNSSPFGQEERTNLQEYCRLNSYALMEITKFLRKASGTKN